MGSQKVETCFIFKVIVFTEQIKKLRPSGFYFNACYVCPSLEDFLTFLNYMRYSVVFYSIFHIFLQVVTLSELQRK